MQLQRSCGWGHSLCERTAQEAKGRESWEEGNVMLLSPSQSNRIPCDLHLYAQMAWSNWRITKEVQMPCPTLTDDILPQKKWKWPVLALSDYIILWNSFSWLKNLPHWAPCDPHSCPPENNPPLTVIFLYLPKSYKTPPPLSPFADSLFQTQPACTQVIKKLYCSHKACLVVSSHGHAWQSGDRDHPG